MCCVVVTLRYTTQCMVKAILIDFFGVVFPDTLNAWVAHHNIAQTKEIHDISVEADLGQISTDEFFAKIGATAGISAQQTKDEFKQFEGPRPHVVSLIERLGENHHIVLVSNSASEYLHDQLERYDLRRLYDAVVISAEFGDMKPNPPIYQEALRLSGAHAGEALFFDDRPVNTRAAEALGIHSIVFESVQQMEQDLRDAGVEFSHD